MADPQKSEVHDVTDDASTSPTADVDASTTGLPSGESRPRRDEEITPKVDVIDVEVVRDESDDGGPIVILSDDPALRHIDVPSDPFPTNRTPEVDPPLKK